MRTRANDQHKVHELMDSIKEIGLQVPVSTPYSRLNNIQYGIIHYIMSFGTE